MEIITKLRVICASLFKPFAGPRAIKSGMGPASEGNPTGYYH